MKKLFQMITTAGSNMKCKVCGGWGGEYGDALGAGRICHECYKKR